MNIIIKRGLIQAAAACLATLLTSNAMAYSVGITISEILKEAAPAESNRAGGINSEYGFDWWVTIQGELPSAGNPWFPDVPPGPPGGLPPGPPGTELPPGPPGGLPPGPPNMIPPPFTVIPVPAAVWLFGSALGLLIWTRRRTS